MSKDYRTISQILEQGLTEAKYTNVFNKIKKVKNLSKKEAEFIANIDPAILQNVINQLSGLLAQNELDVQEDIEQEITEASALDGVQDIVKTKGAKKVKGVMVDMFTASMIQKVYDKVNDANKKKMEKADIQTLVDIAIKVMGMK